MSPARSARPDLAPQTRLILITVAIIGFACSMPFRCLDPVVPQIAEQFRIDDHEAGLVIFAFALPYALAQPILGPIADLFGKLRTIKVCVFTLAAMLLTSMIAPTFDLLLVTRVLQGIVAGGIFPISVAVVSDVVPLQHRQVIASRIMATSISGNLAGAVSGGLFGDFLDWRYVMLLLSVCITIAGIFAAVGLRGIKPPKKDIRLSTVVSGYRAIFSHRDSYICYPATFVEGMCILGITPFVATLLAQQGETRYSIAGLCLALFGMGGVVYASIVGRLLPVLRERGMILLGGAVVCAVLIAIGASSPWQIEVALFLVMGTGFYIFHGSVQLYTTEISQSARSTAMAVYATSLFLGQSAGVLVYGYFLDAGDRFLTLAGSGLLFLVTGLISASAFRPRNDT
ncbi:MAG: MFS transporter [Rhodobiaceae bacterium]|nr:MFS transporter [Rhodobiaceae bacterium]